MTSYPSIKKDNKEIVERRTRDGKVIGSIPGERIFFSRLDFLC